MASPSILPPPIVPRWDVVTIEKIVRDDFEYKIVPAIEIELRSHFQMEPVTITTVFTTATSANNPSGYLMNRKELKGFWLYSETLQICEYIKAKPMNRKELKGFWLYSETLQICEYIKAKPMNRKELKGFWLYSETLQICEYIKAKPWSSSRSETDHVFQNIAEQKILMLWEYAKSHGLGRLNEIEGAIGTAARFVALRVFEKPRELKYEWPLDDEGKQL